MAENLFESIFQELMATRKYQEMDLPEATIRDLLMKELPNHRSSKDAIKEVRKKLHNIIAPYLGNPDYAAAASQLEIAFRTGNSQEIKGACTSLLALHASTRERLQILEEFYNRLFSITGQPQILLDLACGLNPLTFPWMGLPTSTCFHAYDIHRPRVAFINHFFRLQGLAPLACVQDVLVEPPQVEGDVAFLFKEAHRFEQRQKGCNRALWQALQVRYILVSLPPRSLSGHHNLVERQRQLVSNTLEGLDWTVQEVLFDNEMVFVIEKR